MPQLKLFDVPDPPIQLRPFRYEYTNTRKHLERRAQAATRRLLKGEEACRTREYDNCFENGNGDQVMTLILIRAVSEAEAGNRQLWHAIRRWGGGEATVEWLKGYCACSTDPRPLAQLLDLLNADLDEEAQAHYLRFV